MGRSLLAEAPAEAPPADELADAKALHLEGDAKYNTSDFDGAIEAWQKAFAALPRTSEANPYRAIILYNIAAAYEKLFELRGDVEYLKQAKNNLVKFKASIAETYARFPEEGEAERAQVEEKIAHIDELIAGAKPNVDSKPPVTDPQPPGNDPGTAANDPKTDTPPRTRDPATPYFVGGGVLLALGAVAGAGMAGALVVGSRANALDHIDDANLDARKRQFDRGRAANAGAIAAGVVGLACVAAGVALVVLGKKKRSSRAAAVPTVGRGFAGFSIAGRF